MVKEFDAEDEITENEVDEMNDGNDALDDDADIEEYDWDDDYEDDDDDDYEDDDDDDDDYEDDDDDF